MASNFSYMSCIRGLFGIIRVLLIPFAFASVCMAWEHGTRIPELPELSEDELNDLITIVNIGIVNKRKKSDARWNQAKAKYPLNYYSMWRLYLGENRMSKSECIKYLRQWKASTVLGDICSYLRMAPARSYKREILNKSNERRVFNMYHKGGIEVR